MAVSFDDGIKYIECDECYLEIRECPVNVGSKVYHEACKP